MVLRVWRAVAASASDADAYAEHLSEAVFPQLARIDGHIGAYLGRRAVDDGLEVLVVTVWESMDAISRFSGDDAEVAVVEPAARRVLARFDDRVAHYDVVLESRA